MTPQPNQLWNLSGQLFELLEEREAIAERFTSQQRLIASFGAESKPEYAEDLANIQAELDAINTGIAAFVQNKLQEVDELRTPLIALERAVALNKADALAATNRAMVLQNRYDKLKDLIKLAMETLAANGFWKPKQTRKFESARGSFLLKGNGGVQPVEITDETLVPDEYCLSVCVFPLDELNAFAAVANSNPATKLAWSRLLFRQKSGKREVSKSAISEALNLDCARCNGNGVVEAWGDPDEDADHRAGENPCTGCGGSGKNGVPGARLLDRGVSVQIK